MTRRRWLSGPAINVPALVLAIGAGVATNHLAGDPSSWSWAQLPMVLATAGVSVLMEWARRPRSARARLRELDAYERAGRVGCAAVITAGGAR